MHGDASQLFATPHEPHGPGCMCASVWHARTRHASKWGKVGNNDRDRGEERAGDGPPGSAREAVHAHVHTHARMPARTHACRSRPTHSPLTARMHASACAKCTCTHAHARACTGASSTPSDTPRPQRTCRSWPERCPQSLSPSSCRPQTLTRPRTCTRGAEARGRSTGAPHPPGSAAATHAPAPERPARPHVVMHLHGLGFACCAKERPFPLFPTRSTP